MTSTASASVPAAHDPVVLPEPPASLARELGDGGAVAWREPLAIPTYEPGEPSRYPMFLDRRVYQGSSGAVYPLPFVESVSDTARVRSWDAVHLENEFLRLVVLPELGGRIYVGYDKTTDYDFFYRNNVIKPALVGLGGPWVSGGVELNWPQHHRPGTYLPVETSIEHGDDGSVTVWCADHDPLQRMSAQHGVRLTPGSAVVELRVRLHNRTSMRQSFLWWANVAARVHDDYQAFFPEDVRYVADHARRALTSFPAADRAYYNAPYPELAKAARGADRIDWYRNIPVPTSYMIVDSQQDFFGGFDHAAGAGFVHWAERRVSPGKKMWTWGDAPFGHAWDDQLTDADGPYVELMAGVFTDNQPDFSWLLPGETKTFSQYWYPIPAVGVVHQATPDAAVHVERGDRVVARAAVTARQAAARLRILDGERELASRAADLAPGEVLELAADAPASARLAVELLDRTGRRLVRWEPAAAAEGEPWLAEEPLAPAEVETVEELYLIGLHLVQYRHPTRSPLAYWEEALARDPGDVRTNVALADRALRQGDHAEGLRRVERALERLTRRNANPADAEAFYLQGIALARAGRDAEAERAFGKAGWDGTWAPAAGLELARSLARRGRNRSAMRVLDALDGVVGHDARRVALRAVLLRRLGDEDGARRVLDHALRADPLDALIRMLAGQSLGGDGALRLDVALDLAAAGEHPAALRALAEAAEAPLTTSGNVRPLAHYLAAHLLDGLGRTGDAARERSLARAADLSWAFPAGVDAHDALRAAVAAEPSDATARHLLGMLLYALGRRREAAEQWEEAIRLGLEHPVLLRNAGLAAYNVAHDDELAWRRYARAVELAPGDARLRYEQDQLAVRLGHTTEERLARLRPEAGLVLTRDDFTVEYLGLLIDAGHAEEAYDILRTRRFHPWEGGEGRVLAAWDAARAARGLPREDPPASLGEARPRYSAPAAVREDGVTDYFATSLPELLLFDRTTGS